MLTILVDGYELDLSPLADALTITQIDEAVLAQFDGDGEPASPLWQDGVLQEAIGQRLAQSLPAESRVDDLPTLPDQLAALLRTELTLAGSQHPLESAEKDAAEQRLQDLVRPVVYHLIERHYAGKPHAEPAAVVAKAISETVAPSWQKSLAGDWEIQLLDSMLGPIGYAFRTADSIVYSDRPLSAEGNFMHALAITIAQKLSAVRFV